MQRQRLLSDRQQFQREQMKLLELRSPTTLTPQTPLPLTPSARQFVAPTTKTAPPPTDTVKDTASSGIAASEEGVAKDSAPGGDVAADDKTGNNIPTDSVDPLENITSSEIQDDSTSSNVDASDVLTAAESVGGAELLPAVTEEIADTVTTTTTAPAAEDLFPIDFPNSDHHQSPGTEDHMISEAVNEEVSIQQSVEFESANQMSAADLGSPDPTAFDDFDNIGQFDQPDDETNQSDQLDKLAEQLEQLPQQPVPMDDNSDIGVHQLELPTDT